MWRFLNNIPRVFRNHVHSPRPSAGLYVEDEQQESHEVAEKTGCPFTGQRRSSQDAGKARCCSAKVLNSLWRKNDESGCDGSTTQVTYAGRGEGRGRWRSCRYDLWNLFQGSHCMVEAISWGSAVLWGQDDEKRRRRGRLLHRILFAVPGSEKTVKTIKDAAGVSPSLVTEPRTSLTSGHLAIKDAAGAAHDAAINISKAETLDSALEEFQSMCCEYQARYESLQGLEAVEHGDLVTAVEHLRSSCMLGNMSACFNLGLCYETGSGVLKDTEKAKHYYKMAATSGHRMALYNLGLLYIKCTAADADEEDGGSAALCSCGCKKSEGISLLEKAANLGLVQAQTFLGVHHIEENEDVDKAVPYFKAAAQQNDAEAQYFLAICYEQGWGVEVNECRAAQLYSLAASAGHEAALYNLAVFNEEGHGGLPEDQAAAVELYQKAAELGHEQARVRLEEIRASTTAAGQDWTKNVSSFQQLYQHRHTDHGHEASASQQTTALNPAASSPDLTQYLYKGLSFFFGDHQAMDRGHLPSHDPGGHHRGAVSQKRSLMFQLGGSEESDGYEECTTPSSSSPRSSANQSFENDGDERYFHQPGNFHRSYTSPNFSMIACNI